MTLQTSTLFDLSPDSLFAGRYRVVGPHRQGGLSTAFEVLDEEGGGERCELQAFPVGLFERSDQIDEFLTTLEPWKKVSSEWVVRLRALLHLEPTALVIVTDFPAGRSLREVLADAGRMEGPEVIELGRRVLAGAQAIHAAGLVHGDIKPSTIQIDEAGKPLLVDGGITPGLWSAKGLGEKTALIGTPYYAPVEQFGGDSPDVRSDVYNIATVLYECLAGVLPWPGTSFLEVFQAKLEKSPPAMKKRAPGVEVDPALEAVIVRGCLADRRQRFASAEEFARALSALA